MCIRDRLLILLLRLLESLLRLLESLLILLLRLLETGLLRLLGLGFRAQHRNCLLYTSRCV